MGISVHVCVYQTYLKLASEDSISFSPMIGTLNTGNEHHGDILTFWESLFTHSASISISAKMTC